MTDVGLLGRFRWALRAAPAERTRISERQSGAIPYTVVDGIPVFLLVTSRRSGRWIFPKGGIGSSLTAAQSAAREALEEAGVEGDVDVSAIGSFRTWKIRGIRRQAIEVDMYPLRVIRQLDDWQEQSQRRRHWATLQEARRLISERRLKDLLGQLDRRERGHVQPPDTLSAADLHD
ncbi:NUDIX hydrolase [Lutibaculum baratangense]|uniref:NUDIX hydrolase n=1 Tax=Lutibaculum baratangense AMV1 TaxID=631454 RepID=V4REJ7_9HYPH|nr:NUDIX hydrolase [Lutibaculum baratangense]ESR24561.1 NUDIX hydrolase [Lutibaculum baratangense AMV1]